MSNLLWMSAVAVAVTVMMPMASAWGQPATRPVMPATAPLQTRPGEGAAPRVVLEIAIDGEPAGRIVLELDAEKAPETVRNFLRYVDERFYDGTIFHRIIADFMIQGGGYTQLGGAEKKTHEPIRNEARNGLKNQRGTIAMARSADPHSATSQFFINVVDNSARLDPPAGGGWGYCVFGRVVEGMDVVDRIRNLPTRPNPQMPGETSLPARLATITRAWRVDAQQSPKDQPAGKPPGGG